jgi:AcrR family transcriptional regulator
VTPPGRPMIDRDFVLAHRRERLVGGAATAIAGRGYPETTVADIVRIAGVARNTFYEEFSGKEAIFLALLDDAYAAMIGLLQDGCAAGEGDPRTQVGAALGALLSWIDENPAWARSSLIEAPRAGPPGQSRIGEAEQRFAELLAASTPAAAEASPEDARMRVGGALTVVRADLVSGTPVVGRLGDIREFLTQRW